MEKGDYIFAGGLVTAVSILFLAVSTYEIPFYSMEANIQILSAVTTLIGLIIVAYGVAAKTARSFR